MQTFYPAEIFKFSFLKYLSACPRQVVSEIREVSQKTTVCFWTKLMFYLSAALKSAGSKMFWRANMK